MVLCVGPSKDNYMDMRVTIFFNITAFQLKCMYFQITWSYQRSCPLRIQTKLQLLPLRVSTALEPTARSWTIYWEYVKDQTLSLTSVASSVDSVMTAVMVPAWWAD